MRETQVSAGDVLGGRYRLELPLGAGGMGFVWAATDLRLDREVAVKVLRLREDQYEPEACERFEREARAAARLGHPNIVTVTDLHLTRASREARDPSFLVMERLQGRDLAQHLREGPTSAREAVTIVTQLLSALESAHAAGVVHRDVKPANVFLTRLDHGETLVKLLDFGLAYLLEESGSAKLTATGITLGTPAYMAPERLLGERADACSDVYSVGVTLYEMLSGKLPFVAASPMDLRGRILLGTVPSLMGLRPDLPRGLVELVDRAMARDRRERIASAREMRLALPPPSTLDDVAPTVISSVTPRPDSAALTRASPKATRPRAGRSWAPLLVVGVLVAQAAGLLAWRWVAGRDGSSAAAASAGRGLPAAADTRARALDPSEAPVAAPSVAVPSDAPTEAPMEAPTEAPTRALADGPRANEVRDAVGASGEAVDDVALRSDDGPSAMQPATALRATPASRTRSTGGRRAPRPEPPRETARPSLLDEPMEPDWSRLRSP